MFTGSSHDLVWLWCGVGNVFHAIVMFVTLIKVDGCYIRAVETGH